MINATNSATPPTSVTTNSAQSSALTSDFETFLRMLTVQARNQDPLEPLDSSEYASQLAQFSMVEQQVKANELLSALTQTLGAVNLEQLGSWVGMDVQVPAPFRFENQPITIFAQAEATADAAKLVIRNDQGEIVDRITVPIDATEFDWSGVDDTGSPLPAGAYSATLESFKDGKRLSSVSASVFSRVVEAQIGDGAIMLTLNSGAKVAVETVRQIRTGA